MLVIIPLQSDTQGLLIEMWLMVSQRSFKSYVRPIVFYYPPLTLQYYFYALRFLMNSFQLNLQSENSWYTKLIHLWHRTGWMGTLSVYGFFLIATIANKIVMSPIVKFVMNQEKCEGNFRWVHAYEYATFFHHYWC